VCQKKLGRSGRLAADNFAWLVSALSVFWQWWRQMIPAGDGGASWRLRGLPGKTDN